MAAHNMTLLAFVLDDFHDTSWAEGVASRVALGMPRLGRQTLP